MTIWFNLSASDPLWMPQLLPPQSEQTSATARVDPINPTKGHFADEIFSRFFFEDEETGETFVEYIEPLISLLRHPLAKCIPRHFPWSFRLNHFLMVHRSYLVPISAAGRAFENKKSYYFDAGSGSWAKMLGGPSLAPFTALYQKQGVNFDHIEVWDPSEYRMDFHRSVPTEFKERVIFHREWIANEPYGNDTFVPHWISESTEPGDFVVFKMKNFRSKPTEGVVRYLLSEEGREDANRITEFYWDHDLKVNLMGGALGFDVNASQSLNTSYHLFLWLRQAGIRAHGNV
eukprot:CAMPEP_0116824520 /NCGR_PEP_ID=MMETSP0418-20121206/1446_1 /TAXON_ID=1158023 /ORGANISM="Astrosyne radiata, Strain 13vi08-1A" /LENGTH=288 /DNA_ID=CAMNT_0004452907 /DNA_START=447 /DNA_END=1313 /DNA_ORIENTATION=-